MTKTSRKILVDCRWLGIGGAGRATELLLRGLAQANPSGRWILWGPPGCEKFAWPGSHVVPVHTSPVAMRGQRSWFALPSCDVVVFLHQERPLKSIPSVTVMYDTIPLRYANNGFERWLKQAFLRRVLGVSQGIVTVSNYSRDCIVRDLDAPREKIVVAKPPFDEHLAKRVLALDPPKKLQVLYVGRFAPHKNLRRLIEAFRQTNLRKIGGQLALHGGTPKEIQSLKQDLRSGDDFVSFNSVCTQDKLDELLAESLFLVQPSLEEGFGLPPMEALSTGLPVCCSNCGGLPEATFGMARYFVPTDTADIVHALDECALQAEGRRQADRRTLSEETQRRAPTLAEYTEAFLMAVQS